MGSSSLPRVESGPPALGAWRLSHWTTGRSQGRLSACVCSLDLNGQQSYKDKVCEWNSSHRGAGQTKCI